MGCVGGKEGKEDRPDTGAMPDAHEMVKTLNPRRWMTQFGDKLAPHKLQSVAMVGAHDCATYNIVSSTPVGVAPDAPDAIAKAIKVAGGPAFGVISDWARTQEFSVRGLLERGVRYLDIRLATKNDNDQLWISHSLYSIPFARVVEDIAAFYGDLTYATAGERDGKPLHYEGLEHNKELIVLDIVSVEGAKGENAEAIHQAFCDAIQPLLPLMFKDGQNYKTSIGDLWASNTRILCFYKYFDTCAKLNFAMAERSHNSIQSKWHDKPKTSEIKPLLEEELKRTAGDDAERLTVLQAVLTPGTGEIVKDLLLPGFVPTVKESILDYAKSLNDDALELWAKHPFTDDPNKPFDGRNILMMDFVTRGKYEGLDAIQMCWYVNCKKFGVTPGALTLNNAGPGFAERQGADWGHDGNRQFMCKPMYLKSTHGTYMDAHYGGDGAVITSVDADKRDEDRTTVWYVLAYNSDRVILRSYIGTFLRCPDDGDDCILWISHKASEPDTYTMQNVGGNKFKFASPNGKTLYVPSGTASRMKFGDGGDDAVFELEPAEI